MPFGAQALILVIVVVVFAVVVIGATKLPGHEGRLGAVVARFRGRQQRGEPPHLLLQRTSPRRWTLREWLLLGAALLSVAGAAALLTTPAR
jgi:hypothetical protein